MEWSGTERNGTYISSRYLGIINVIEQNEIFYSNFNLILKNY
jgi:hypothetical protein